ncbi:hypothetical protein GCM10022221_20610 [Actinocorallia aurea]
MPWFRFYHRGMEVAETAALASKQEQAKEAADVRSRRRWLVAVGRRVGVGLVAVFAAIGVAATGYVAWTGFPWSEQPPAEKCADDRQAAQSFRDSAVQLNAPQSPEAQYRVRLWAQVVAAAPDCFDTGRVAVAREFLARK